MALLSKQKQTHYHYKLYSQSYNENQYQNFKQSTNKILGGNHPAIRRRGDVVKMSLYTSQWRRRYFSNEAPNDVSVEHRQDVSLVSLHNVLLERRNDVLRGRNNDVSSVRLRDVSNMFQMNHQTTSQWYDLSVVRIHNTPSLRPYNVSCKSQMKYLITLLWYFSTMSRSYVVATVSAFSSYFVMSSIR